MSALTIVLADDHHVVRQGLRTMLETELSCSVVGEAADGQEAVELVARLQPTVLVLDMVLPSMNGLEVIRRVCQVAPQTRIVVLSMHADEAYVREALRVGATAYVLKESKAAEFVHAVCEAAAGRRYLSSALSERAIEAYIAQTADATLDLYETLTNRERDVLALAAKGHTTAEIAAQLSISARTVEAYRASMLRKLGLHSQTDLIRYALRRGIIPLEE
jgi:DNA-binding NarL/FixJ family response regulator